VYVNIADDHTPGEGRCTFKYVSKIDEKVVVDGKCGRWVWSINDNERERLHTIAHRQQ